MVKRLFLVLSILIVLSALFTGCSSKTEDTRQYIDTMGVVFTNEAGSVINELFVFPIAIDGTDVFEQDMGPDIIKNTSAQRRIGSYGVTVEVLDTSYNVMARDRSQGIYIFQNVPLTNVCEAVLTFDSTNPVLTIYHKNGAIDAIVGQHIREGDAPDHAQIPLKREVTLRFTINNSSNNNMTFISMREAANPDKGEVELYIGVLESGGSASLNVRLFEEDKEITAWILCVETADGISAISTDLFNPWEVNNVDISINGDTLVFTTS